MTLTRQIILAISLVFLLVLVGVFVHGVWNTRAYLNQQLGSHAQDTATSLALSLGPVLQQQDMAAAQSLVDAIADRGYYQRIEYFNLAGKSVLKRETPIVVQGVPPWFVEQVKLDIAPREALIMSGWQQQGRLQVTSHTGYAYRELWEFSLSTAAWLGAGWLLSVLGVAGLLRVVMAPLTAVEQQAQAIGQGRFVQLDFLPRTRELRRVVSAMNVMAAQVERIIGEKIAALERIEQDAILDGVTGLPNRQQMEMKLTELLRLPQRAEGIFALVHLSDLEGYNNQHGYQAGNSLLKTLAQSLRVHCALEYGDCTVARFGGAEFALLVLGVGSDEVNTVMQRLMSSLPVQPEQLHVGVTDLGHQDRSTLLGAADLAVRTAQGKTLRAWHQAPPSTVVDDLPRGAQAWRVFILQALEQDTLVLQRADVVQSEGGGLLHKELLAQMAPVGRTPISASAFMPMVERLQLAARLDRVIVSRAVQLVQEDTTVTRYAINLSPQSIKDAGFVTWLAQQLQQHPGTAQRISLEIPAITMQQVEILRDLMQRLAGSGVQFAIDRVSAPVPAPEAWPGLSLAYMKLDAAYVMSLDGQVNMHVHLDALREFARGLGLPLIATGIANDNLRSLAVRAGVDGLQGVIIKAK